MRPVIGLIPLADEMRNSLWMLPGYMQGIEVAGGLPIMLPLTTDPEALDRLCTLCDAFLLTGGHDVSPAVYSESPIPQCGTCCEARDGMEAHILRRAIESDKPVLGICRGIQLINALLGGTLYQDLPAQYPSDTNHHQSPPYDVPVHSVSVLPDTPLHKLLHRDTLRVNSYHHQAVKRLSAQLVPMAISEDGLVEAVYRPGSAFLWAVQWHPEFAFRTDPSCMAIFSAFIAACAAR